MRIILFIVWVLLSPYSDGQYTYSRNQLASQRQERQGNSWDIRLAVPGEPGTDYPTLGGIPKTSFSCAGKKPGYYADIETSCQAFRICTLGATYGFQSFLCPNGTLFNQQVFVCDWWMNVNCQESQKYYIMNNDKYENLRLGAHMMNDIKSMLTHSMRNPYDKANIKSNYMVMQDYTPPSGQMFPNGAQRSGFERALSNVYVPAKQLQSPFNQNNVAAASTPSPQYVPSVFNNARNNQIETFQRQAKTGHYSQNNQQTFSNGHSGKLSETNNAYRNGKSQSNTRNNFQKANYEQNQVTNAHTYNTPNTYSSQVNTQYRENTLGSAGNTHRQSEFGISYKKEQFTYPTQPSTISTSTQHFTNDVGQVNQINEAKSNLVSEQDPTLTSLNKKNTFNRRVKESNQPSSASRLTFNAWLISEPRKARARVRFEQGPYVYNKPTVPTAAQPARLISEPVSYVYNPPTNTPTRPQPARIISEPTPYEYNTPIHNAPQPARLISEPTPYVYNKPTNPPAPPPARLISDPTPYVYPKPTAPPQIARIVSEPTSYYYNKPRPTQAAKLISESGYVYNRPTAAPKLISTTTQSPRTYLAPTTHRPTPPPQLYFVPTTIRPTFSGPFYLVPTTPDSNNLRQQEITFGRQRLEPNVVLNSNSDLEVSPTAPTPVYLPAPAQITKLNTPSFRLTKQSRINSNRNNLTFTDILTKEKLDITVHDIVKDTSNVLGTVESNQLGQLRQEPKHDDYPDDNYLPPGTISPNDHVESIPFQHYMANSAKFGKLIAAPATNLEPPLESFDTYNENNQNPIAKLPFYKQTNSIPANTIERTVSLKISIPEKTAAYLFNTKNDTEYDKLEILNTGSSNYLVLSNHNKYHYSKPNFIPIGKLVIDENSNISNSQALVFSFLADSLNAAKEYKNIVDENLKTQQQYNNEDVSEITNNISQLTSSQYTQNTVNTNSNIRTPENLNMERGNIKYSNGITQTQAQITQRAQDNPSHSDINSNLQRQHSADYTQNRQTTSLTANQNIFSGQLYQSPVPEVTNQIYNEAKDNFVPLKNTNIDHTDFQDLHQLNSQSNVESKQGSAEVEIVKSHNLQLPSTAAKLQVASAVSSEAQNSQEDNTAQIIFNNLINGNGITAQVRDKIIGSISHPHDDKKIVTYKKDQSYYVYTKLEDNIQNKISSQTTDQRNGKLIQSNNAENSVTLQLVPSISYQVNDEKEKQRILNAFQINEYGSPNIRNDNGNTGYENQNKVISNVDYTVNHSVPNQSNGQYKNVENLYNGPSSYSAPQSSVGRLEVQQQNTNQNNNNNFPARLEQFNEDTGYQRVTPSRQFSY